MHATDAARLATSTQIARGKHISLLGMDGIGKTSMARLLEAKLRVEGRPVQPVSWRNQLHGDASPNVRVLLQELWVESWRLLFLGDPVAAQIPSSYASFEQASWEARLAASNAESNLMSGPLAACWLEIAAQVVLYHEVIRPLCERGVYVIEESYALKLVLKELLAARSLSAAKWLPEIESALRLVPELFGPRKPDIVVVITGSAELAYRRRMAQTGSTNSSEDLGLTGKKGAEGFLRLQSECDERFRASAKAEGWLIFEMVDAAPEVNFERLFNMLGPHLQLQTAS